MYRRYLSIFLIYDIWNASCTWNILSWGLFITIFVISAKYCQQSGLNKHLFLTVLEAKSQRCNTVRSGEDTLLRIQPTHFSFYSYKVEWESALVISKPKKNINPIYQGFTLLTELSPQNPTPKYHYTGC